MSKKRLAYDLLLIALAVLLNVLLLMRQEDYKSETFVYHITVQADAPLNLQLYYIGEGHTLAEGFSEGQSAVKTYADTGKAAELTFELPSNLVNVRLDPADAKMKDILLSDITMTFRGKEIGTVRLSDHIVLEDAALTEEGDGRYRITTLSDDAHIIMPYALSDYIENVRDADRWMRVLLKVLLVGSLDLTLLLLILKGKQAMEIPRSVFRERKLVWELSKNDFKTRFAGSYLGVFWAFVQPVVTVLVYWFVFQKALNAASQSTKAGIAIPFVAWLVAGLVPWFYFSEVVNGGTNVLYEYSFLVKKVVFNISALPVVKAVSALFVHLFFIAFALILATAYGYYPSLYTLQLLYYSAGLILFSLGIVYLTSATVVFFRDLSQIINVILQVLIWATPIMWNFDGMYINPVLKQIFKLNPLFYIVQGYREALFDKVWFFEHAELTVYFWIVTVFVFLLGTTVFRRLRVHYADVL